MGKPVDEVLHWLEALAFDNAQDKDLCILQSIIPKWEFALHILCSCHVEFPGIVVDFLHFTVWHVLFFFDEFPAAVSKNNILLFWWYDVEMLMSMMSPELKMLTFRNFNSKFRNKFKSILLLLWIRGLSVCKARFEACQGLVYEVAVGSSWLRIQACLMMDFPYINNSNIYRRQRETQFEIQNIKIYKFYDN